MTRGVSHGVAAGPLRSASMMRVLAPWRSAAYEAVVATDIVGSRTQSLRKNTQEDASCHGRRCPIPQSPAAVLLRAYTWMIGLSPTFRRWCRFTFKGSTSARVYSGRGWQLYVIMAKFIAAAVLLACVTVAGAKKAGRTLLDDGQGNNPYSIGLWGDLPYSAVQSAFIPNLIADMNAANLAFSVYDGDLKAGSGSLCNDALYTTSLGYFNSLTAPAIYTPGDNEWTDCDRASNGGYNSTERLDHIRSVFFSTPFSLGGKKQLQQDVQTDPLCLDHTGKMVACVENRRWHYNRVTYITVNVPGSCNNLCDTDPNPAEFAARNAANIAWMKAGFAEAIKRESVAVMIVSQADPGFDKSDPTRAPLRDPKTLAETDGQPDGFQAWLVALRTEVQNFKKPVAYVHGDSHYFRVDKPLQDATGARVNNFVRVETPGDHAENGDNDVNWVRADVDPRSREVFSFAEMVTPSNAAA